jgi:hypothetical protein
MGFMEEIEKRRIEKAEEKAAASESRISHECDDFEYCPYCGKKLKNQNIR